MISKIKIFRTICGKLIILSNYASKADLKNAAGVDTPDFAKKTVWGNLKSNVGKLDIDKLKNVPRN